MAIEMVITSRERAEGFRRVFRKAFLAGARGTPHDAPAERMMPYQQEAPGLGEL